MITQPKVRDLFKSNNSKADALVEKLISLINSSKDVNQSEIYTRLISHLAFCVVPISDDYLNRLMLNLMKHAFSSTYETQKL